MSNGSWERYEFMIFAFLCREIPFLFYYMLYKYNHSNKNLDKYKIQQGREPDEALVSKAIKKALIDHLIVQIPVLWFSYDLFLYAGSPQLHDPLPPVKTILLQGLCFVIICDTLSYWTHRILHHPLLYTFHKQHHEFHTNHPLSSLYFGTVDDLFTGVLPTIAGPALFKSHVVLTFVWLSLRICESVEAHFGYQRIFPFPYPFSSLYQMFRPIDFHDFHHSHSGNYGVIFPFWDRVCGTDKAYNNYCNRKKK